MKKIKNQFNLNQFGEKELEEKNKKFFKKLVNIYDKGIIGKVLSKRVKKVIENIHIKNNSKVLDVGCGTGNLLFLLLKLNKNLELHGLDLTEDMLKVAKRKLGSQADLKKESIRSIGRLYKKSYFDYIFVSDAFHHFPQQKKFISNVIKLLKKGGKLFINEFSFTKIGNFLFHKFEPGNSGMMVPEEYKLMFLKNNLKNIKYKRIGPVSFYIEGTK